MSLTFIEPVESAYLDACKELARDGIKTVQLIPYDEQATRLENLASGAGVPIRFQKEKAEAVVLLPRDAEEISSQLLGYLDDSSIRIVAPITERYFQNLPLFLISIPKSGTHLLYRLAQAFGYGQRVVCREQAEPGFWYCVEYSNSHTVARDFFVDRVRRAPFGNRLHPFLTSPALFIYRNPLDILVSEANYYHKDGNAAFGGYLSTLSFEDRLLRLADDPFLLGSIRDRVGGFLPWLDFPNVIPLSFEELIGPRGGGTEKAQSDLIWSLQLKLHVPGAPKKYADRVFDPNSPTFHEGRIGAHRDKMTEEAWDKVRQLPRDFMEPFGYESGTAISTRVAEFRMRPLRMGQMDFAQTPVAVDFNFRGHDIVRFRGRFYGIPYAADLGDIAQLGDAVREELPQGNDLQEVQHRILLQEFLETREVVS